MITTGRIQPRTHAPAVSWGANLPAPGACDLAAALLRAAENGTGEIRFVRDDRVETLGYGELVAAASKVLGGMRDSGTRRGDKVAIGPMEDDRDLLTAFWACVLGGLVPVPLGAAGPRGAELEGLWDEADTVWAITDGPVPGRARSLDAVAELASAAPAAEYEPGGWDDLAVLLPTRGPGVPKAVMLSHGNILSRTVAAAHVGALGPAERTFNWMPLGQAGGLIMSHLRDVYLGCVQVHAPTAWILDDPLRWIDQLHEGGITVTAAPNFAFELVNDNATRMRDRRWDLGALSLLMNGGEGMGSDVLRRFLRLLEPHGLSREAMCPGWGRAETASTIVDWRPGPQEDPRDRFVGAGHPYPGVGLRIVNHFGEVLPEGELGLLEVTGEPVSVGYYGDEDANRRAFSRDRWFRTGELAYLEQGRLTVTGRIGDLIVIAGDAHDGDDIERTVETVGAVEPGHTVACAARAPESAEPVLTVFYCPRGDVDQQVTVKEIREAVRRDHGLEHLHIVAVAPDDIPETGLPRLRRALMAQRFEAGMFDSVAVSS